MNLITKQLELNGSGHYLLVAFPFIFYLLMILLRGRIKQIATKHTKPVLLVTSFSLMIPSVYIYIDNALMNAESDTFASIFANMNVYLSFAIGYGILTRRYALVQMALPAAIVFGILPLINDPQGHLSTINALNDVLLSVVPLITLFITGKNLQFKGQLTAMFISVFVLVSIFTTQNIFKESLSMSTSTAQNATFYWFKKIGVSEAIIILTALMFLQALTFVIIRFLFSQNKNNFMKDISIEIRIEKMRFSNKSQNYSKIDFSFVEYLFSEIEIEEDIEEEIEINEIVDLKTLTIKKEILPTSVQRCVNSVGARAPSL